MGIGIAQDSVPQQKEQHHRAMQPSPAAATPNETCSTESRCGVRGPWEL